VQIYQNIINKTRIYGLVIENSLINFKIHQLNIEL